MRRRWGAIALGVIVAACGSSAETTSSVPAAASTTAVETTVPSTTPASATSSTITDVTSTVLSRSTTTTTAPPELSANRVIDLADVDHMAVLGDSLYADLTEIGGRDNQVVPLIREALAERGVERVDNLALPGQSVLFELGVLDESRSLLSSFVRSTFRADDGDLPDLVLIGVSSSDVNTNAGRVDAERLMVDELADEVVSDLRSVIEHLDALDVDAVVLPIVGISDEVFGELRCALRDPCDVQLPDAQIDAINERLASSGLPLLFPEFDGLDADGRAGTDAAFSARSTRTTPMMACIRTQRASAPSSPTSSRRCDDRGRGA